jgi:hypothetical protein
MIFYLEVPKGEVAPTKSCVSRIALRLLHHLPSETSIEQVEMRLLTFFETQQLQTPIQISNPIQHIYF